MKYNNIVWKQENIVFGSKTIWKMILALFVNICATFLEP